MNKIEKIIFKSQKWFFLKSFFFDSLNKLIVIEIYPNDNSQELTSFIFRNVQYFSLSSDEKECEAEFPKQILGIDYDEKKSFYLINCGDVEYHFNASPLEELYNKGSEWKI